MMLPCEIIDTFISVVGYNITVAYSKTRNREIYTYRQTTGIIKKNKLGILTSKRIIQKKKIEQEEYTYTDLFLHIKTSHTKSGLILASKIPSGLLLSSKKVEQKEFVQHGQTPFVLFVLYDETTKQIFHSPR